MVVFCIKSSGYTKIVNIGSYWLDVSIDRHKIKRMNKLNLIFFLMKFVCVRVRKIMIICFV